MIPSTSRLRVNTLKVTALSGVPETLPAQTSLTTRKKFAVIANVRIIGDRGSSVATCYKRTIARDSYTISHAVGCTTGRATPAQRHH